MSIRARTYFGLAIAWMLATFADAALVHRASAQAKKAPAQMNVLTFNIFVRDFFSHDGQYERLERIPNALASLGAALDNTDVIVFQELWLSSRKQQVVNFLERMRKELGFKYTERMDSDEGHKTGLAVASRFVPTSKDVVVYDNRSGFDEIFAGFLKRRKAFFWISFQKDGRNFHLVGTHMQADAEGRSTREKQSHQLAEYIKSKKIPKGEPILIAGDLNIDGEAAKDELTLFLNTVSAAALPWAGTKHCDEKGKTFACSRDRSNPLLGSDGDAGNYDCRSKYDATGKCDCCPQTLLDHVVYVKNSGKLLDGSSQVLRPLAGKPFRVCMAAKKRRFLSSVPPDDKDCKSTWEVRDVSDHYAVMATMQFE